MGVIINFKSEEAEIIFNAGVSKKLPSDIQASAFRKLGYLHQALTLQDLRSPPGNRLEALAGKREGQHSIRINDQWRICFVWDGRNASEVEVIDYH